MGTVIFGAGKAGQYLLNEMAVHRGETNCVDAVLDNFADTAKTIQDVPVYRPVAYLQEHRPDRAILAAGAQKAIWQMIQVLRSYHVDEIYMLHDVAGKNRLPLFDEHGEFLPSHVRKIQFSNEKPTLPYFEMPIIDDCNLNCKGCLFNCNRHGEKSFMTLDEIVSDFRRMKELFFDIPWIRILGGEPLLHPQLSEVVRLAREIFPDTEIDICTNGLRIPMLSDEILQEIADQHVTVHVSEYRPVEKMSAQIAERLSQFGIEHCFLKREEFYKFYTQDPVNDAKKSHEACLSSGCREVYRGRLVKCSAVLAFERMNKQFGTHYEVRKGEDWFDLYDAHLTGWEIMKKLDQAVPACRYCDTVSAGRKTPLSVGRN